MQALTFVGAFGPAQVDYRNELWRVEFDGRHDWYGDKEEACKVAISFAHRGVAPEGVLGLIARSRLAKVQTIRVDSEQLEAMRRVR